ncbi:MAG TPA: hypothetical protein VL048_12085 [Xanthobacteraceae bacterium]|nr:hypothetical protein [Xanthobacteraceae bacterium]
MSIHEIVHSLEDNRKIVVVPLANSCRNVKLDETDYRELEHLGVGLPWRWSQEQVWVRNNNRNISVARLILDADKGEKISFKDGDPSNLVRSNLVRIPGSSQYRARDQVVTKFKRRTDEVIIFLKRGD